MHVCIMHAFSCMHPFSHRVCNCILCSILYTFFEGRVNECIASVFKKKRRALHDTEKPTLRPIALKLHIQFHHTQICPYNRVPWALAQPNRVQSSRKEHRCTYMGAKKNHEGGICAARYVNAYLALTSKAMHSPHGTVFGG